MLLSTSTAVQPPARLHLHASTFVQQLACTFSSACTGTLQPVGHGACKVRTRPHTHLSSVRVFPEPGGPCHSDSTRPRLACTALACGDACKHARWGGKRCA